MKKIFEIEDDVETTNDNIPKIKTKYETFGNTLSHKEEFEKHLQNVEIWCANR